MLGMAPYRGLASFMQHRLHLLKTHGLVDIHDNDEIRFVPQVTSSGKTYRKLLEKRYRFLELGYVWRSGVLCEIVFCAGILCGCAMESRLYIKIGFYMTAMKRRLF